MQMNDLPVWLGMLALSHPRARDSEVIGARTLAIGTHSGTALQRSFSTKYSHTYRRRTLQIHHRSRRTGQTMDYGAWRTQRTTYLPLIVSSDARP
jgi:hypothetical protein